MNNRKPITLRLPPDLVRYIKIRAVMNDRTTNAELTEIIRGLKNKKAEEYQLGGPNSSASQQRSKEINQ